MEPPVKEALWLSRKQVTFSGQFAAMSRAEASRLVKACGGEVASAVSRETSFLVLGQHSEALAEDGRPAPRIRKAVGLQKQGCGIQILSEEEFLTRSGVELPDTAVRQLYSGAHVCRILKIPTERLARWQRTGLVRPCKTQQSIAFFDFRQVSWAKTLCNLTEAGVRPSKIRRSLGQLKNWLSPDHALAQLTLLEQDGRILVRLDNGQLAETNGQPHLSFDEEPCTLTVAPSRAVERTAADWHQTALTFDEAGQSTEAIDAYHQALAVGGPDVLTCFNLANCLYQAGHKERALERYRQVVEMDASYAQAWNNLGNLQVELGENEAGLGSLRVAVRLDSDCPSYRYNLADLLDEMGQHREADEHWRACMNCGETGRWADYAQRRLASAAS